MLPLRGCARFASSTAPSSTETRRTTETGPEREVVTATQQGRVVEGRPETTTTGSGPAQTIKVADRITFVDGAYDEMAGTADGRAATPWRSTSRSVAAPLIGRSGVGPARHHTSLAARFSGS